MKKLLILLSFTTHLCYAQHNDCSVYNLWIFRADSMFIKQNFKQSNECFSKAFTFQNCIIPYHLYNAACAAAKDENINTAFSRLFQYIKIDKNWYSEKIKEDNDLVSLHSDPRWNILIDTLTKRQQYFERNYNKPLRSKLKNMMKKDQEIRYKYLNARKAVPSDTNLINTLAKEMAKIDRMNVKEVCKILDSCGWVGKEQIGDACNALWIIIQHSNLNIQKKYLPFIREATKKGDISHSQLAMLEDRINVWSGLPQKYGSQIIKGNIAPLLDTLKVDEWRKEVGLPPLSEYAKRSGIEWKTK